MADKPSRDVIMNTLLAGKRAQILRLAAVHGATNVRVFGSLVRGESGPDSDVDILVTPNPEWSLLERIRFQQALEALLGIEIDLVTDTMLHPRLRQRILDEAVPL